MSNELAAITGRLNALEALTMMFAGIILAQAPNDPDHTKAIAIMDEVRRTAVLRGEETGCPLETACAADELLSSLSESLGLLRRGLEGGAR
jgi:hypothetical protein